MEKLDKKVSWSEKLTDVKVITTQPSTYEHLTEILEDPGEEEEEEEKLIKEPCIDLDTINCNKQSN